MIHIHVLHDTSAYISEVHFNKYVLDNICTVLIISMIIKIGPVDGVPAFIDAGLHAREWIAPATALNIIQHVSLFYNSQEIII